MSRVEAHKRKKWFSHNEKQNNNSDAASEEALPINGRLNYQYSIITILVVTGLLLVLKLLTRLEKQLFWDSQYNFYELWNMILNIGEAMFISALIPVGIFIISFIFYFVPNSNFTFKRLEISYSRAIIYLIYCLICTLSLIPAFVLIYFDMNQTFIIPLIVVVSLVIVIFPLFIIKRITKEPALQKGYIKYLLVGLVILISFIAKPYYKDLFPSLTLDRNIYYSSEDTTVLATFEGKAIGGFLCPRYGCSDNPDEGILLERYNDSADPSKTTFIVDLTDPEITAGTYEIKVYYRSKLSFSGNKIEFSSEDLSLDDNSWYQKSLTRNIHYVFDGKTPEERKQYYMKYMNRINMTITRDNPDLPLMNEALRTFTNVMEQSNFYISEDILNNEIKKLNDILPKPANEILLDLQSDSVFHIG